MKDFENWFAKEQSEGLVDFSISVVPSDGISAEKIQQEILASEAAISAEKFRSPPAGPAFDDTPEEIKSILQNTRI